MIIIDKDFITDTKLGPISISDQMRNGTYKIEQQCAGSRLMMFRGTKESAKEYLRFIADGLRTGSDILNIERKDI